MSNNERQKTTVFSVRLPDSLLRRLEKLAERQSRTVSNLIRLTLEEKVNGTVKIR
jgi:predicted transcriptional regulator